MTRRLVLVTGMSGGGKASILRALEDLGYEAVDNPPLPLIESLVAGTARRLAIGVDARTHGFDAARVLDVMDKLRANPALDPTLVYAWASRDALMRRYTETRRRHPLAPQGLVSDGIEAEEALTAALRTEADLVIDTSGLPVPELRLMIDRRFGDESRADGKAGLLVALISFAFPGGLPMEADMVFDARFLRNPHYDPILRSRTGLDPDVADFVEADPDYAAFFARIGDLLDLVLPRFVAEGKKVATIAIGCTGGRHRSVHIVERLSRRLDGAGWRLNVAHRELSKQGRRAGDLPSHGRMAAADQAQGA
jgi:UPF0042 nucleotide-binding protein